MEGESIVNRQDRNYNKCAKGERETGREAGREAGRETGRKPVLIGQAYYRPATATEAGLSAFCVRPTHFNK